MTEKSGHLRKILTRNRTKPKTPTALIAVKTHGGHEVRKCIFRAF